MAARYRIFSGRDRLRPGNRLATNPRHDLAHKRLYLIFGKSKSVMVGHNLYCFQGAIDDDPTSLAFTEMLLKSGAQIGAGHLIQIITEFAQEFRTAKHVRSQRAGSVPPGFLST